MVSVIASPALVNQKSLILAIQPGAVCMTIRLPSSGVRSRMTFSNWPCQKSAKLVWPRTIDRSAVAPPVAMKALQWLPSPPVGANAV